MILKVISVTIMSLMGVLSQDPFPADSFLPFLSELSNSFDIINAFDGPGYISHAKTNPTSTKSPTTDQILYYSYYAASVYCPYELNSLNCRSCQNFNADVDCYKVLSNDTYNTLALVTVSHVRQEIVITYRGSANVWNFVLDFTFLNVNVGKENPIKIYRGFYAALMSLYSSVVKSVNYQRKSYPNYNIVIVGHSLGGSMARLCEFFFLFEDQFPGAKYEVYTYGELRSGNKYFVDYINYQQNVITARESSTDVTSLLTSFQQVLRAQISSMIYDYYLHAQPEYWLNDNGDRFCNNSVYEDATCSDSTGLLLSLVDHETYFDENFFYCFASQPLSFFALPFDLFTPVGTVPPFPNFISGVLGSFSEIVLGVIGPILGR